MKRILVFGTLALVALAGCKKEQESVVPEKPADASKVADVKERMSDPEYVKQLDAQREQQQQLARLMAKATNDAERAAVTEALEKNRQETMRLIRERMMKK